MVTMIRDRQTLMLFAGVLGLLVLATIVGQLMRLRRRGDGAHGQTSRIDIDRDDESGLIGAFLQHGHIFVRNRCTHVLAETDPDRQSGRDGGLPAKGCTQHPCHA